MPITMGPNDIGPRVGDDILYDEQGRPYYWDAPGKRHYFSPVAFGGQQPADNTSIFRKGPEWNSEKGEWDTPIDWSNIMNIGVGSFIGAGAANALGAFGGAPGGGAMASPTGAAPSTAAIAEPGMASILGDVGTVAAAGDAGTLGAASIPVTESMMASAPAAITSAAASQTPGIIDKVMGGAQDYLTAPGRIEQLIGAAGAGISGYGQATATNRGQTLQAMEEQEKLRQQGNNLYQSQLINRADEDRNSMTDAFTKSIQAQRMLNDKGYTPPSISQMPGAAPTPLPVFSQRGAPTEPQRTAAQGMYDEVSKRLTGGSQLPPMPEYVPYTADPELLKQTGGERIANWVGPTLTALTPPVPQPTRSR